MEHPRIIEAFNRGLRPTDDGRFKLEFGADWCLVEVEDAAYGVLVVDAADDGRLSVRLSDRTAEWLDVATLALGPDGVLRARGKGGRATLRFSRDAQFALGNLMAPEGDGWELRVGPARWPVPRAAWPRDD